MNTITSRTLSRIGTSALALALMLFGSEMFTQRALSQTQYVYFPSASTTDGRFLSMAGSGLNTLGEDIVLKLAARSTSNSIEVGIFDGETGGQWDQGTVQMQFSLYADPAGNGTGTTLMAQWSGSQMPDNDWFSATIPHTAGARGANGDYFYILRVSNPNPSETAWSNFKVRTSGTVVALIDRPFAYTAPLHSLADAQVIFPNYPTLTPTTYDGSWSFFIQLNSPATSLTVWDGDMDFGSYDCQANDTDDEDTPNGVIPAWASSGSAAVPEGIAASTLPCTDGSGAVTGGTTTSNPADDARNIVVRREPNVRYDIIDPNGVVYANNNPSGNLEWEQFRISTDPFNRSQMDYHAASLPAGVYEIRIQGVDMSNLNAWRFPYDALGVDAEGRPVAPIRPYQIAGSVYYDVNGNGRRDRGEPGIPSVTVTLNTGVSVMTDDDGDYEFRDLEAGTYTVAIDMSTLAGDVVATGDPDGTRTRNIASITVGGSSTMPAASFGYKRSTSSNCSGTKTVGYWTNNTRCWPLRGLRIGCRYYSKDDLIEILQKPTAGDKTYLLAAEYIAAELNDADGNSTCGISYTMYAANLWLTWNPIGSNLSGDEGHGCSWNSPWALGSMLLRSLQSYNVCRPACGRIR